jgi:hypothetical protein
MPKERRFDIDFIAGLCILHMMWVHAMQLSGLTEHASYQVITTLAGGYMAWFFFKSGMFYKKSSFRESIKKMSIKVLVPFVVLSFIAIVTEIGYGFYTHQLIDGMPFSLSRLLLRFIAHSAPSFNLALWFLPCFFFVHIILAGLQKKFSYSIVAVCALILGAIFDSLHLYRECFGGNIFFGLFFFCCGFLFKEKQYEMKYLILASFIVFLGVIFPHYISAATNSMGVGFFYPFGMLFFLGKSFLVNRLFKNIPSHKSIIALVGRNAMFCFSLHFFFLVIGKLFVVNIFPEVSKWSMLGYICMICTLCLVLTDFIMTKLGIRKYL